MMTKCGEAQPLKSCFLGLKKKSLHLGSQVETPETDGLLVFLILTRAFWTLTAAEFYATEAKKY